MTAETNKTTAPPRPSSAFVPHDLPAPMAGAAQGPLAGLTAAVKDIYDIAGTRTGGGSPDWLAAHPAANTHAAAVQRILGAGATIVGKTICDEFCYSVTGDNAHYGTPPNPRAPGRLPGGSSSGSASAVAAGACDFALGSDTGGSVRVPAAFCGLYGIRPTHGRIDLTGAMGMAPSFDVGGWLAGGPGVFRRIGTVLLDGRRVGVPIDKLIVLDDAFAQADPEIAALAASALDRMAGDLPGTTHRQMPTESYDLWREIFRIVQAREVWGLYGDFITRQRPRLGPGISERFAFAAQVSEQEAEAARQQLAGACKDIRDTVPPGTVLALPTVPCPAPRIETPPEALQSFRARVMRLTCIAGVSGLPQITIPVGAVSGCQVGLSFIGWAGGDETLLDLAAALSRHCGLAG